MKDEAALLNSLAGILPGERLITDQRREEFAVDGLVPRGVAFPATPEEASAVLAAAYEREAAVIPWGGGTSIGLGNPPSAYDLALSLTRVNSIVEYEPADLSVAVQAGVRLRDLQERLAEQGQFLPLDPPGAGEATIGGILAVDAAGPLRYAYGSPHDMVMGLKTVLADGRLTGTGGRVVKNVAGYDMAKLYVGSLGSLGVILEATLKVVPLPMARATLVASCPTASQAAELALAAHEMGVSVHALEVLDARAAAAVLPPSGVQTPENASAFVAAVAGSPAAVERSMRDLESLCRDKAVAPPTRLDDADALWQALGERLQPRGPGEVLARASLLPSQAGPLVEKLGSIAEEANLNAEIISHVGVGVVYSRWSAESEADLAERGPDLVGALMQAASELGGAVVIESCPTDLKRRIDVWGEPREDFPLMWRIKEGWDPRRILNPGRFVGRL